MNSHELKICKHIKQVAVDLHAKNMLAAADGNISVRLSTDYILITPSGVSKARMDPQDMAVINSSGQQMVGQASSEAQMHLAIYNMCPDAKAIVHAHPPAAVAWSIARPADNELPSDSIAELILSLGSLPIVPYSRPGTPEASQALKAYLPDHRCLILARHGAICWGECLEEAHAGMERIEHSAMILSQALRAGGLNPLPREELKYLRRQRTKLGKKTT